MKLPNAEIAFIDPAKLSDYLLSEAHPFGRYKAAFFRRLGYTRSRWRELDAGLRRLIASSEAELGETTRYGQKYIIAGTLDGPERSARVVTVWIILLNEDAPRFVTAFPGARA